MAGSRKPAKSYGAGTPYPLRANPALKPGPKTSPTPGNTVVGRPGRTAHMTRSLTSSIGARAMRSRAYRGGADSLYTASVIAIRPKTGELVWHYQYIPNESFDFDGSAEPVLVDLRVDGQVRKAL